MNKFGTHCASSLALETRVARRKLIPAAVASGWDSGEEMSKHPPTVADALSIGGYVATNRR
jgi:1-acyl-sn-glycerol-3-phosphate acyltransferase